MKNYFISLILVLFVIASFSLSYSNAASELDDFSFTDVSEVHQNVKAIDYLKGKDVVIGYGDKTYKPEKNITRAEFLKIVMKVSSYSSGGSNCFPDVKEQWHAEFICAAKKNKLVDGYDDGFFRPDKEVTFVEGSKMISNVLKLAVAKGDPNDQWYKGFVLTLEDSEVIPDDIDSFVDNLTRAQMAEMIWRIVNERTYKPFNTYARIEAGLSLDESNLYSFQTCKELHDYIEDNSIEPYYELDILDGIPESAIPVQQSMAEKGGGGGMAKDFSGTNVQVSGVDEADIVKNDGKYIYLLKGSTIRIVEAYPPSGMKELDRITFDDEQFAPKEMYVDGDTLVVIGDTYVYGYYDQYEESLVDPDFFYPDGSANVYIYDISDRANVELIRNLSIEGDYSSSRKVDDTVYVVAEQKSFIVPWIDGSNWKEEDLVPLIVEDGKLDALVSCEEVMYMPRAIDQTNYIIVVAIPLNPAEDISSQVVIGSSGDIYSSRENLYVAQPQYEWYGWYTQMGDEEKTYIHKFSLDGRNIDYKGMGTVPGTILNQFSMDEYDGNFRIATTLGDVWDSENLSTNNVYILSSGLRLAGKVEGLAPGERIYSVRFTGKRAYMVTFKKIDPLFVIDVSNPRRPAVLGKLKIPGFSDYLHPYDENHLIGFGLDTVEASDEETGSRGLDFAWYQGVKLAMFDVTDVKKPVELHREIIGDRGTTSPLNYNHKALLYSTTKGIDGGALMAFPIAISEIPEEVKDDPNTSANTYGDYVFQGAYVYDVNPEDGFTLRGRVTHYEEDEVNEESGYYWYGGKDIERVLYMDEYLYTTSQAAVKANKILKLEDEVNRVDLAE